MVTGFGTRVASVIAGRGNLCAGIDPHPSLLDRWGLNDDPTGLAEFVDRALEGFAGVAAVIKPQSAFFERHGSEGIAVLERLLADARSAGVPTLLDVKRGDIGSTMDAYADAYLTDRSPLAADAVTVSPYLGFATLAPAIEAANSSGRGVFVLCLTSNPEGAEVQQAVRSGESVAAVMASHAARINHELVAAGETLGSVGLVVGATVGDAVERLGIDLEAVNGPILAPGFGEQGADSVGLARVFGGVRTRVLVSSSRGLLAAGPTPSSMRDAAERARDSIASGLEPV